MPRLFGTDGIRDIANGTLSPLLTFRAGRAGAHVLSGFSQEKRPQIVVGRDTRLSGPMLFSALAAGINSAGADVLDVGILPTPAIACLTKLLGASAGVVISASHNPFEYNGIKFFNSEGFKLEDETEESIEEYMIDPDGRLLQTDSLPSPTGERVGRILQVEEAQRLYIDYVVSKADVDLTGHKVVVDCANGSAYMTTPLALRRLGAEVIELNCAPDGRNINDQCGSTYPSVAAEAVVSSGADYGLSHDGDADRILALDERGQVVDGDKIMAICSRHMLAAGRLPKKTVVATVYSNMGLVKAIERNGGRVVVTKAGDRYVLEEMRKNGYMLGGEQSGHIIFLEHTTTGDGLIAGLQLVAALLRSGTAMSELASEVETYPQALRAVKVSRKEDYARNLRISEAIDQQKARLNGDGRVFVRPSGTEPVIRVMVEGAETEVIEDIASQICSVIAAELA